MSIANCFYSGFNRDDQWGHRAPEPHKAVICSLALAKLRTDIRGDLSNNSAIGMAQKLLLFWRKPARRCWWEGIELDVDLKTTGYEQRVVDALRDFGLAIPLQQKKRDIQS